MSQKKESEPVKCTPAEMKQGYIYYGAPAGEFFKKDGMIFFKSAFNGLVRIVNPHPGVIFVQGPRRPQ